LVSLELRLNHSKNVVQNARNWKRSVLKEAIRDQAAGAGDSPLKGGKRHMTKKWCRRPRGGVLSTSGLRTLDPNAKGRKESISTVIVGASTSPVTFRKKYVILQFSPFEEVRRRRIKKESREKGQQGRSRRTPPSWEPDLGKDRQMYKLDNGNNSRAKRRGKHKDPYSINSLTTYFDLGREKATRSAPKE